MSDVKRNSKGQMLAPLPGKHTITQADASILARKRWAKYRQEAVKRITGEIAAIEDGVDTGAAAFGVIAAKQALALMDSEKPRIADLERLGQIMTGYEGGNSRRENAPAQLQNTISAPPAALLQLFDALEQRQRAAVDRSRAVDGTATEAPTIQSADVIDMRNENGEDVE